VPEALAFQEAAGICRQPLFLRPILELRMRALILLAVAAFSLSACGKNDQADNTVNIDEDLTAENIVANDVTAIDAVTADSANMAADVDIDFTNELASEAGASANGASPAAKPKAAPQRPKPASASTSPAPAKEPATTAAPATNSTE